MELTCAFLIMLADWIVILQTKLRMTWLLAGVRKPRLFASPLIMTRRRQLLKFSKILLPNQKACNKTEYGTWNGEPCDTCSASFTPKKPLVITIPHL